MTDAATTASGKRLIAILVGAVASGKGTQAGILSQALGVPHLASGNLFRAAMEAGTTLGNEARGYIERGDLVPDEITIGMFMAELASPAAARGAILDGFPRTVAQARALDESLAAQGERVSRVIFIDVPTEELVSRASGRWICPTCGTPYHLITEPPRVPGRCDVEGDALMQRDDDRPEVVRARLEHQVPPMLEVIDHYERQSIVDKVDGDRPVEAVSADILERFRVSSAEDR
jgi:adenylate kinase